MKYIKSFVYPVNVMVIALLTVTGNLYGEKKTTKIKSAVAAECYDCHDTIKDLHKAGKHVKVGCASCHSNLENHMANPGPDTRPSTNTSWEACGKCHKELCCR